VRRLAAAALVATGLAVPAGALGHRVPGGRSVVAQIEQCELVLMVAWHPQSGDEADALRVHAARGAVKAPRSGDGAAGRLRALYGARAMAPLSIRADGRLLSPRSVEVKLVRDPPGSDRLAGVALVSYELGPDVRGLEIANNDPHRTRFSWVDRSDREFSSTGLAPHRWTGGLASILLLSRQTRSWSSCDKPSDRAPGR